MNRERPFHPSHLAAIQAARAGDTAAANALFGAASHDGDDDPRFLADHAVFKASVGEHAAAASLYARAIALTEGGSPPLRLRHAIASQDAGHVCAAVSLLEALTGDYPQSALAWQALGAAYRDADRIPDAAAAFDRVLGLQPDDPLARLGRAQMMEAMGAPSTDAFVDAAAVAPLASHARLGLAMAEMADGRVDAARKTLAAGLTHAPGWVDGWAALASLDHRWSGRDAALARIGQALAADSRDPALAATMLRTMASMGAHEAIRAALPAVRIAMGDSLPLVLIEAQAESDSGELQRADALFATLRTVDDDIVRLARVRHALRAKRPEEAVAIGVPMLDGPASRFVIPYLGTAWRMTDDARHNWLQGDPRLVGSYSLGLSPGDLAAIADELRALHTTRHPPFEQSVRGGTQTEGTLLSRQSPGILRLREALRDAVRRHIDQMPPIDPTHPTLSIDRGGFRFSGSWSVRLTGSGGHHVNHVHSEGWLSSACYIALPASMTGTDAAGEAGWLTLGQPPLDLGLDLAPTKIIRPAVGNVVLFPSTMWHGTRPAPTGERLTVAFDVQPLM